MYTLYTNDCRSVDPSTQCVRFSEDTAMLALLSDFAKYQSYYSSVVIELSLVLSSSTVNLWNGLIHSSTSVLCKMTNCHLQSMLQPPKKYQQRLHVLRKLRAFYVDPLLLLCIYRSIIEPLITYCGICYYLAVSVKNRNRLLKNLTRFCQDHWFTYTNALRNNRPCNFEERSLPSLITRFLRSSMYFRLKGDTVV